MAVGLTVTAATLAAAAITLPALTTYHRTPSPPFQALARARESATPEQAVSGHYLFFRYLPAASPLEIVLPHAPGRTLQALGDYWRAGGRKQIAFLNDPARHTLRFSAPENQDRVGRWSWLPVLQPFLIGARPGDVELVRLDPPVWFSESELPFVAGALPVATPGGVAPADALRLHLQTGSGRLAVAAVGSVVHAEPAFAEIWVAGRLVDRLRVSGHFVLRTVVETGGAAQPAYMPLVVRVDRPVRYTDFTVVPDTTHNVQFESGFFPPERDEADRPFRWMGQSAQAAIHVPAGRTRLKVIGEIPLDYFSRRVRLTIRWNGQEVATVQPSSYMFKVERPVAAADQSYWGNLTLEASDTFVPASIEGGGDIRELSFRISDLSVE
jgi:hypothetical protein